MPLSEGLGPAARVAGLGSLGLHAALLAWFLAGAGGGPSGGPPPEPTETPIYVSLVSEPAAEMAEDPPPPAPVLEVRDLMETPAEEIPPEDIPSPPEPETAEIPEPAEPAPVRESAPKPVLEPQPEASPAPKPKAAARLTEITPPARPARPAKQAAPKVRIEAITLERAAKSAPAARRQAPTLPAASAGAAAPGPFIRPATYPDYLANPAPAYPHSELRRRREGVVELSVRVSAGGRPEKISVSRSSGISAFDEAAIRAVRGWRFIPASNKGKPVPGWVKVPIRFTLRQH
jgi:protein TonB